MTKSKHPSKWKFKAIHESELAGYRSIPGSDDMYRINAEGKCVTRRHSGCQSWPGWWIQMKPRKSRIDRPYNRVDISIDGERKSFQISRILLQVFVGQPPSADHVACHINGKTDDDRLENLKWGLPVDAKTGQIARGTYSHGDKSPMASFKPEQVRAMRTILKAGISQSCLANAVGVPQVRIREIALGLSRNPEKHVGRFNPLTGETIQAGKTG